MQGRSSSSSGKRLKDTRHDATPSRPRMIICPFCAPSAKTTSCPTLSFVIILLLSSVLFLMHSVFVDQLLHSQKPRAQNPVQLGPRLQTFNFTQSSPSTAPNQSRLALCFSGNARTFHYDIVHGTILKKVLYPLANFTDVDVFFNIKMDDDPIPGRRSVMQSVTSTRAAMARFNPVVVNELREDPNELDHVIGKDRIQNQYEKNGKLKKRSLSKPVNCSANPKTRAYVPHSLYRAQQCLTLIRKYEMAHGFQYTYVYKTRPDVVFVDNIPIPNVMSPGMVLGNIWNIAFVRETVQWAEKTKQKKVPGFGDHFMASLRHDADVAFNAFNAVHECELFKAPIRRNPESMLLFWLLKGGLTPVTPHVVWMLVREKQRPPCEFISKSYLENSSLNEQIEAKCRRYVQRCDWKRMALCRP